MTSRGLIPNLDLISGPWNSVVASQAAYERYTKTQLSLESEPHASYVAPRMTREQMDALTKRITDAEKQRTDVHDPQLEALIMSLRSWRNYHYWYTFRINDLPNEILANVFRYVCWSTVGLQMGIRERVWITGVCRKWRNVALGDSTLWNTIWIRLDTPQERAMTWFERAGSAPIDLKISEADTRRKSPKTEHKFAGEQMRQLLDRLFTKLSQIRMLIVIVDNWPPVLAVLDKLYEAGKLGKPVNFERIEIHRVANPYTWNSPGYEARVHETPISLCGGKAWNLKYLALNGVSIDWYTLPLANLTTLDLRRMALQVAPDLYRFREMLAHCPSLKKLTLEGFGPKRVTKETQGLTPICLPSLKTFVLGDVSLAYSFYVMTQFRAPNVRELTFVNMKNDDYSHLFGFLTGKFPDVRSLTLYTIEIADQPDAKRRMVAWLKSMPTLGYFRFAQLEYHILDAFLEDRSRLNLPPLDERPLVPPPRQVLCPRLNAMEYQFVDTDVVVAFGKGRKELGIPLRIIYVNGAWLKELDTSDLQALQAIAPICYPPLGDIPEELAALEWESSH